ncbi:MAG: amino acid racemase [Bacteroidales bacterium]|nr:amino acid racemase [Bacteroidales bacterium]
MKEKLICIGGGVGPMAGVELHRKIIENTETNGTDQDHLEVHHFSRSHDIGDRTRYLLNEISENPAEGMLRTATVIDKAAQAVNKQPILGIPCNTFHAPEIFNSFLELLKKNNIHAKVLNMITETGKFIKQLFPNVEKIGLMSTTGTRNFRLYNNILELLGFSIIEVPEQMQEELHDSVYNKDWGIKAKSPVSETARNNFLRFAKILADEGAEVIILGCTEIPSALPEQKFNNIPLVNPMTALSRALISEVAPEKLCSIEIND